MKFVTKIHTKKSNYMEQKALQFANNGNTFSYN